MGPTLREITYYEPLTMFIQSTVRPGSTENARHETTAQSKMQGWKLREAETVAQKCTGGKCGTNLYGQPKEHLVRLQ